MKITIESTTRVVTVNGLPCRLWEGETAAGVRVEVLITRIAVRAGTQDLAQFERELEECRAPSAEAEAFPLRMLI